MRYTDLLFFFIETPVSIVVLLTLGCKHISICLVTDDGLTAKIGLAIKILRGIGVLFTNLIKRK